MIKVGIVQFMAYPETMAGEGPVIEAVTTIARDDFFGAIEITHIKDADVRRQVAALLAQSHLTVGFGAQPVQLMNKLDLNSFNEQVRSAGVQVIKSLLAEASEVGAGNLALLSGPDPGPEKRASAIELLVESLVEICRCARELYGMEIILEVFDRDIDKKALIGSTEDAVKVAEAVKQKCSNFGLLIDLSHLPLTRETARHSLQTVQDHLVHVHIGNCVMADTQNPAYGDQHPRFGYPGGEIDVPELTEFLAQLLTIGYLRKGKQAVVTFEVKPTPGENSDLIVANAKRTLREAWARL